MRQAQTSTTYDELRKLLGIDARFEITSIIDDTRMGGITVIVAQTDEYTSMRADRTTPVFAPDLTEREAPGNELEYRPLKTLRPAAAEFKPNTGPEPFEFYPESNGDLQSCVMQALGAASMCWSTTPTGIFESERAEAIGLALMGKIQELQGAAS